jgi:anti-sigma regulatory factor (Ser/Thr protein kinase)
MFSPVQVKTQSEPAGDIVRATVSDKLELKCDVHAPSIARAATWGRCDGLGLSTSLCQTLVLLVSEVVSNAVLHSNARPDTPIVLATSVTEDAVRVTVTDTGDGFVPKASKPAMTEGGYGLYILGKTTRRWGVDRVGGTRVWFELSRTVQPTRQIEEGTDEAKREDGEADRADIGE